MNFLVIVYIKSFGIKSINLNKRKEVTEPQGSTLSIPKLNIVKLTVLF